MIGAQHVYQLVKTTLDLVTRIGHVGSEIGKGAVRLSQRAIDVITEIRCAEKCLLAIFPVLGQLSLGGRQPAPVDETFLLKRLDALGDGAGFMQRPLGKKYFVADVEKREIGPNHIHHHGDGLVRNVRKPLLLPHVGKSRSVFSRKSFADRFQIISGV